ncbi:hypothetical protein D918_02055 [Trichuris suis]|nr:hypothetical protein D918_02055 [Trichuris suis]
MAPSHDDIFGVSSEDLSAGGSLFCASYRFKVMREQVMLISSTSNDKIAKEAVGLTVAQFGCPQKIRKLCSL